MLQRTFCPRLAFPNYHPTIPPQFLRAACRVPYHHLLPLLPPLSLSFSPNRSSLSPSHVPQISISPVSAPHFVPPHLPRGHSSSLYSALDVKSASLRKSMRDCRQPCRAPKGSRTRYAWWKNLAGVVALHEPAYPSEGHDRQLLKILHLHAESTRNAIYHFLLFISVFGLCIHRSTFVHQPICS